MKLYDYERTFTKLEDSLTGDLVDYLSKFRGNIDEAYDNFDYDIINGKFKFNNEGSNEETSLILDFIASIPEDPFKL